MRILNVYAWDDARGDGNILQITTQLYTKKQNNIEKKKHVFLYNELYKVSKRYKDCDKGCGQMY